MIITKLDGQLGNQMFTYAAGYALSRDNSESLAVFRYEYETVAGDIGFQIGSLNIDKCNLFYGIPLSLYWHTTKRAINRITNRFLHRPFFIINPYHDPKVEVLTEPNLEYHKMEISNDKKYHLMTGFRQSPLYFDRYRGELLRQFTPSYKQGDSVLNWLSIIENEEYPVSLHIRRGDYVKAGLCIGLDFYYNAVKKILNQHPNAVFFVFSNDIEWVKKNLNIDSIRVRYVEHTSAIRSFDDIWLMSKCKSNIIANSSFSWWAAYLNQNPDKIVYAPIQILNNNRDIMCPGWTILE